MIELRNNITESSLLTRSLLDATAHSFKSNIHDTSLKLETLTSNLQQKITAIENLSSSDPQVKGLLQGATLDHVQNLLLSPAIDEVISNAVTTELALISQGINTLKTSSTSSVIHPKPTLSFAQLESKEFYISKFTKELEHITLQSDSLKDLEIFWDSIQCALTNICQTNQVFPYYRDLTSTFTFCLLLLGDPKQPNYFPLDFDQAKRNYCSFGDALYI